MNGPETGAVIHLRVNGEPCRLPGPATVASLVASRQPQPPFAVELNGELVRRPDYSVKELREGDQIEIVTLVGGG